MNNVNSRFYRLVGSMTFLSLFGFFDIRLMFADQTDLQNGLSMLLLLSLLGSFYWRLNGLFAHKDIVSGCVIYPVLFPTIGRFINLTTVSCLIASTVFIFVVLPSLGFRIEIEAMARLLGLATLVVMYFFYMKAHRSRLV